jgi:hypothetical protein
MTTENQPHVVYDTETGFGQVFQSYGEAHERWLFLRNEFKDPVLIATLGRVIDPSQPIIDVNE